MKFQLDLRTQLRKDSSLHIMSKLRINQVKVKKLIKQKYEQAFVYYFGWEE